jgi:peroxiredoxin
MKRLVLAIMHILPPIAAVATVFAGCNLAQPAIVGDEAPGFSLPLLDGGEMDLARHAGRDVVVLDFWATWCPPCREGLPSVAELAVRYADRPVAVYAVNIGESAEQVREFLQKTGIEVPVALDASSEVATRYKVRSIPTTIVIGRDGVIHHGHVGHSSGMHRKLISTIDNLLKD